MTRLQRLFAWLGGTLFVASLLLCAYRYLIVWSRPNQLNTRHAMFDAILFAVFAAHHSLFARERVKAAVARVVPDSLLRCLYVWTASVLFIIVCAAWQPIGGELYRVSGWRALAHAGLQLAGLCLIGRAARAIDPLELAGVRHNGTAEALQVAGPYRWVRHPLYLGWILTVFGAAQMTGDRLAFATISSTYLVVAIRWEERSLARTFGGAYEAYRRQVRWRIVPYVF